MTTVLTTVLSEDCFATIQTMQIQSYTLPSDFDTAIENSTLVTQEIQTATQDQTNTVIDLTTMCDQAVIQMPTTVNNAQAAIESLEVQNESTMSAFYTVSTEQATGYAAIKSSLGLSNSDLLTYIKNYVATQADNPIINVPAPTSS